MVIKYLKQTITGRSSPKNKRLIILSSPGDDIKSVVVSQSTAVLELHSKTASQDSVEHLKQLRRDLKHQMSPSARLSISMEEMMTECWLWLNCSFNVPDVWRCDWLSSGCVCLYDQNLLLQHVTVSIKVNEGNSSSESNTKN